MTSGSEPWITRGVDRARGAKEEVCAREELSANGAADGLRIDPRAARVAGDGEPPRIDDEQRRVAEAKAIPIGPPRFRPT